MHVATRQALLTHWVVATCDGSGAAAQLLPQPPQCAFVLVVLVSQPLVSVPSQLPHPELQLMPQALEVQVGVPFVELHALLQPPQCVGFVAVLISQPFDALLSQLPKPALHVMPHTPLLHVLVPLVELHTLPHEPQFVVLFDV